MNINCNRMSLLSLFWAACQFLSMVIGVCMSWCRIACGALLVACNRRFVGACVLSLIASQVQAVTHVSGSISVNTTWTPAAGPYVIESSSLYVNPGVTLTIEPGTVIKSAGGSIDVRGTLHAQGTAQAPIIFTSLQDDSAGGDSNADGAASSPAKGNWYGLFFESNSGNSVLDHVEVRYAGSAAVRTYTSNLTLQNSTISDSERPVLIQNVNPSLHNSLVDSVGENWYDSCSGRWCSLGAF